MSVVLSASGQVKPGKYPEFIAQAEEASKLYQRLGATTTRLMTAGLAGEAFGTWTFSVELENLDAFGRMSDEWQTDSDAQSFLLRIQEANAPTVMTGVALANEVPLRQSKGGRGPVMAIYLTKVHPGGLERALEMASRASAFAEAQGCVNARVWSLIGAGSSTGMYVSTMEFENTRGYTKVMEAFTTEPEGQAIATTAMAADAPSTLTFDAVYTEIPL